jgi:NDP-sugar pyrophosphorylase family protein
MTSTLGIGELVSRQSPHEGVKHEQKTTVAGRSCHCRADRRWRFVQLRRKRQDRVEGVVVGAGDAALEGVVVGAGDVAREGVVVGAGDAAREGVVVGARDVAREGVVAVEGVVVGAGDAALEGVVVGAGDAALEGVVVGAGDAAAEGVLAVKGSSPSSASPTRTKDAAVTDKRPSRTAVSATLICMEQT